MEFVDDVLYGITGNFLNLGKDGRLLQIDTKTGKAKLIVQTTPANRWAGIAVGTAVPADNEELLANSNPKSEIPNNNPEPRLTQKEKEKEMQLLTIDTKANCYVIDPDRNG